MSQPPALLTGTYLLPSPFFLRKEVARRERNGLESQSTDAWESNGGWARTEAEDRSNQGQRRKLEKSVAQQLVTLVTHCEENKMLKFFTSPAEKVGWSPKKLPVGRSVPECLRRLKEMSSPLSHL